jgi:hypothetical protein
VLDGWNGYCDDKAAKLAAGWSSTCRSNSPPIIGRARAKGKFGVESLPPQADDKRANDRNQSAESTGKQTKSMK